MAHVLLAEDHPPIREIYTTALELGGHQVTAPDDFWSALAVLRSTPHPLVVVYDRDMGAVMQLRGLEERLAALEANRAGLQRHRYVGVGRKPGVLLPPWLAALEDALDVEVLHQPIRLEDLIAAVQRAAERLQA